MQRDFFIVYARAEKKLMEICFLLIGKCGEEESFGLLLGFRWDMINS